MVGYPLNCICWKLRLHLPIYYHIPNGGQDIVLGMWTNIYPVCFTCSSGSECSPVFTVFSKNGQSANHSDRTHLCSPGFSLFHSTKNMKLLLGVALCQTDGSFSDHSPLSHIHDRKMWKPSGGNSHINKLACPIFKCSEEKVKGVPENEDRGSGLQ